nr:fibulin-1-like [Leptinotarsa decemlineata]
MLCKMGFELNESGDKCIDINECTRGTHKCQPTQICKNYHGYYTCECPPGHHLNKITGQCEDLDECRMFRPCRLASSKCVNLIGSFRCDCKEGFEKKYINECGDIDECLQTPGLCEHNCINIYGTYRCSCKQGFTLNSDNRTCTDIDECERFKDKRLCIGTCKNVPGSYTCECPPGYELGSDGRVCIDIDECQESNVCLRDEVCLNTRGGYKCYRIKCPPNYVKDSEHKARCKRMQSYCDLRDYQCLLMPEQYTYQYITLVSNLPMTRDINLFRIKGPEWYSSRAQFSMKLLDVNCPAGVQKVNERWFRKVDDQFNSMVLYLVKPIQGPQEIKLQIELTLFQGNTIIGNAVVYIIIVVSEYTF